MSEQNLDHKNINNTNDTQNTLLPFYLVDDIEKTY